MVAEREKKGLSWDTFLDRLRGAERPNTIVCMTGGCGNTKRGQWQRLERYHSTAYEGFGGIVLFGGTAMKVKVDEKVTDATRTDICQIPLRMRQVCPKATFGPIVNDPGGLPDEKYGRVLSDENGAPYKTVINDQHEYWLKTHEGINERLKILEEWFKGEYKTEVVSQWDREWLTRVAIIEELNPKHKLLQTYHGGGATKREVSYWLMRGWDVALIPNLNEYDDKSIGTTQRFIDDLPKLRSNGRIYVPSTGAEMREILRRYEGIIEDESSSLDLANETATSLV